LQLPGKFHSSSTSAQVFFHNMAHSVAEDLAYRVEGVIRIKFNFYWRQVNFASCHARTLFAKYQDFQLCNNIVTPILLTL